MKAFVSIPVQILGKQFLGTRESAKEITDWIRKDPNARYNRAELHEGISRFGLDSRDPHDVDDRRTLNIHCDQNRYFLEEGDWLVLIVDTGVFTTSTHSRLTANYTEL